MSCGVAKMEKELKSAIENIKKEMSSEMEGLKKLCE